MCDKKIVTCAKPWEHEVSRSCDIGDLFHIEKGLQCANCGAVYSSGDVISYDDAIKMDFFKKG